MITLQEAERLLKKAQEHTDPGSSDVALSDFLTVLVSAGAFRTPDAHEVRAALLSEGVTQSATEYTMRVLRKLGIVS